MDDKIRRLIIKLIDSTKNKSIKWSKTDRATEYYVDLKFGRVLVDNTQTRGKDIVIFNTNGESIFYGSQFDEPSDDSKLINDLYERVVSQYLNADETIEGLLDELNNLGF